MRAETTLIRRGESNYLTAKATPSRRQIWADVDDTEDVPTISIWADNRKVAVFEVWEDQQ